MQARPSGLASCEQHRDGRSRAGGTAFMLSNMSLHCGDAGIPMYVWRRRTG
jgi:hypothetical protein